MTKPKKPINTKLPEPYCNMTREELEADTRKFDGESISDRSRPLSPRLRARLKRAARKRGRPRVGKGAKKVLVTIERELLRRSDMLARRKKISRSQLIARGLEAVLSAGK